jgi:hypothetical protein
VTTVHSIGPNISLVGIDLSQCFMGGHKASDASLEPPHSATNYPPRYLGTRPGYGIYVRNAHGVRIKGLKLGWDSTKGKQDERPAVVLENATVVIDSLAAQRDNSSYDVGIRSGAEDSSVTNSPGVVVKNI